MQIPSCQRGAELDTKISPDLLHFDLKLTVIRPGFGSRRETQNLLALIRTSVWWTTIAISAAAAWFEWQYRRSRRRQEQQEQEGGSEETPKKPPVAEGEPLLRTSEQGR